MSDVPISIQWWVSMGSNLTARRWRSELQSCHSSFLGMLFKKKKLTGLKTGSEGQSLKSEHAEGPAPCPDLLQSLVASCSCTAEPQVWPGSAHDLLFCLSLLSPCCENHLKRILAFAFWPNLKQDGGSSKLNSLCMPSISSSCLQALGLNKER